jgi:putative DNA methylase
MWLSKRKGDRRALVATPAAKSVQFSVSTAPNPVGGTVGRSGALCLLCRTTTHHDDVRAAAGGDGLGRQLLCVVADKSDRRTYIAPGPIDEVEPEEPADLDVALPERALGFRVQAYGMRRHADLYTPRQLVMLEAFAEAIWDVPDKVRADGGDAVYAATIASILGLALGKLAQTHSTQSRWYVDNRNGSATVQAAFGRHAMPMVWDFVELNPFARDVVGDWLGIIDTIIRGTRKLPRSSLRARVSLADARSTASATVGPTVIVTDPPYFDQIGYADLSDFFYVWHRRALRRIHPDLYSTIVTPKEGLMIQHLEEVAGYEPADHRSRS